MQPQQYLEMAHFHYPNSRWENPLLPYHNRNGDKDAEALVAKSMALW